MVFSTVFLVIFTPITAATFLTRGYQAVLVKAFAATFFPILAPTVLDTFCKRTAEPPAPNITPTIFVKAKKQHFCCF